jgi:nanoRNase/pAp phosphatase (c-di-AMP/oligoRNAs hydrolase)
MDNYLEFISAMKDKRLLHLGHIDADCDAFASAYALSRLLPGDIGFALSVKSSTSDLAEWLSAAYLIDPNPMNYEYTIIHDTYKASLLGMPIPTNYAIFDHHEPGGHRFAEMHNELAEDAEWVFVKALESTCSVLIDLFLANDMDIDRGMGVAFAAAIITDTAMLQRANGGAMQRLSTALNAAGMYVEDVLAIIDNPKRKSKRRVAMMDTICNLNQRMSRDCIILSAETDTQDHGFVAIEIMNQIGGDVQVIGFSKWGQAMVMLASNAYMVDRWGFDLGALMRDLAPTLNSESAWGTSAHGRIIAPLPVKELINICVDRVTEFIETS